MTYKDKASYESTPPCVSWHTYGVDTISRLLKNVGLFCRIWSLLWCSFAKEPYNLKARTDRSHPIYCMHVAHIKGHITHADASTRRLHDESHNTHTHTLLQCFMAQISKNQYVTYEYITSQVIRYMYMYICIYIHIYIYIHLSLSPCKLWSEAFACVVWPFICGDMNPSCVCHVKLEKQAYVRVVCLAVQVVGWRTRVCDVTLYMWGYESFMCVSRNIGGVSFDSRVRRIHVCDATRLYVRHGSLLVLQICLQYVIQ